MHLAVFESVLPVSFATLCPQSFTVILCDLLRALIYIQDAQPQKSGAMGSTGGDGGAATYKQLMCERQMKIKVILLQICHSNLIFLLC